MSTDVESSVTQGFTPKEVKMLYDNREDIEQALKLKKIIDLTLLALLMFDMTVLVLYVLTFALMMDHAWFDWLDLVHVFLVIVMIMCIADTTNIYRNLKYLLVLSLFFFAIDIIISSFLRPLTIENSNPFNERKIDLKRVLLVMQAMLTVVDFLAFVLAVYFRYGSALKYDEVHGRYVDIEMSRQKYMKTSILYHLSTEGQEIRARELQRKIDEENRAVALHNRIDDIRRNAGAGSAPAAGGGGESFFQRKYEEYKDNYNAAVTRRNAEARTGAQPVPRNIEMAEITGSKKAEENKRIAQEEAATTPVQVVNATKSKVTRHQRTKVKDGDEDRSYFTKFDSSAKTSVL